MSTIDISVIAVDKEDIPKKNGKGTYGVLNVTYKNLSFQGKVESFKVLEFATDKEVWNKVGDAQKGDNFTIEREKNDNGYWQWKGIARQDGAVRGAASSSKSPSSVTTKSTYQTPEERAAVQLYIIRQSSIASAVNLVKDHGKADERTPDNVIAIATQFENYVLGAAQQTIDNIDEDIPL